MPPTPDRAAPAAAVPPVQPSPVAAYFVERWTAHGLACAIGGYAGPAGYVQLPHGCQLPAGTPGTPDTLEVHGGINYGPDPAGWIGFDASHAFDWWPDHELNGHPDAAREWAARTRRILAIAPAEMDVTRWTRTRLRREVERLAAQVAARLTR